MLLKLVSAVFFSCLSIAAVFGLNTFFGGLGEPSTRLSLGMLSAFGMLCAVWTVLILVWDFAGARGKR